MSDGVQNELADPLEGLLVAPGEDVDERVGLDEAEECGEVVGLLLCLRRREVIGGWLVPSATCGKKGDARCNEGTWVKGGGQCARETRERARARTAASLYWIASMSYVLTKNAFVTPEQFVEKGRHVRRASIRLRTCLLHVPLRYRRFESNRGFSVESNRIESNQICTWMVDVMCERGRGKGKYLHGLEEAALLNRLQNQGRGVQDVNGVSALRREGARHQTSRRCACC